MTLIKHARLSRSMRLKDVAETLETDPGNLSRIESGRQKPSVDLARRIGRLYGLSLEQVFDNPAQEAA